MILIHGYIPKSKKQKISKSQKLQHDLWLADIMKPVPKFSRTNSKVIVKNKLELKIPPGRETPKYSSLTSNLHHATKSVPNVYTGNKVKGIATMHKSNAVPVFSNNEAVEISSMRR